jgi:uncharacterized RDD family membrane protein YckC
MSQGSQYNPYQAPSSDSGEEAVPHLASNAPLATRVSRLLAAIVDGLIQGLVVFPLQFAFGVYEGFPQVKPLGVLSTIAWTITGFLIYLAFNAYLLNKSGQTIGKRIMGIRIVNHDDGQKPPLARLLLLRVLPVQVVSMIPVVGGVAALIDVLLIFRKNQRCLHDQIAGTDVVAMLR